jgi:uncharacterized membrane protein
MLQYLIAWVATAVTFFVIDFVWLGVVAKTFYRERIGALMLDEINVSAAVIFYLVYVLGIVIFAVAPALQSGSWVSALTFGALFGFFAYATYDMTNFATLRGWPVEVVVVDILWGTFLTGASALIGFLITRAVLP